MIAVNFDRIAYRLRDEFACNRLRSLLSQKLNHCFFIADFHCSGLSLVVDVQNKSINHRVSTYLVLDQAKTLLVST